MTLLLSRSDVQRLLSLAECTAAVEAAFRLQGEGRVQPAGILGMHAADGGFHVKAAFLPGARAYFAAKVNANFPANPRRFGLPTIQGVVLLADAADGQPLALIDSIEITTLRTGAATAVATRHLARKGAAVATVCGCGVQGRVQLRALAQVLDLKRAFAWDVDVARARIYADELSRELRLEVAAVEDLAAAMAVTDVCVTCTPSRRPFLERDMVRPGTFVAAVGADSAEKQELDPALLAAATVVVDVRSQCESIGELHHAIVCGYVQRGTVHAELGDVVAGVRPGRVSETEITVFDSTGTALEDAAAAAFVYEKALRAGAGTRFGLAG